VRKARLVSKVLLGALAPLGCKEQPVPERLDFKAQPVPELLAQPGQLGQQAGREPQAWGSLAREGQLVLLVRSEPLVRSESKEILVLGVR
jgi:hypothetical protein